MPGCIFCGTTKTTNAHVFRRAWIDGVMPRSRRYRQRRGESDSPEPLPGDWTTDAIDLKVNSVCESCNGDWMDKLDHAAEDVFLTHGVLGYDVKLSRMAEKETLARWCGLIAVLLDQTLKPPTLPRRVQQAIYAGDVPEDMQAWIYRTVPPDGRETAWATPRHLTVTARMRSGLTHVHDVYFATFSVQQLVVQVAQPSASVPGPGRIAPSGGGAFRRQIWPPPLTPLFWPPPETLTWEDARDLPNQIMRQGGAAKPPEPPSPAQRRSRP